MPKQYNHERPLDSRQQPDRVDKMTASSATTLSRPHPAVWQISLTSPPDHRLTPELFASLSENLDIVEAEWRKSSGKRDKQGPMSDPKTFGEHRGAGALILTGSERFFSNGLDYQKSMENRFFFEGESSDSPRFSAYQAEVYDPVLYRLLTFPLVTIAAINGHGKDTRLFRGETLINSVRGRFCARHGV